jgi:hypothetical protein
LKETVRAVETKPGSTEAREEQERKELFELIREFQESSGAAEPDEVMREVLEAQQAVRIGKAYRCRDNLKGWGS